jgi:hypothetical protein
MYCDVDSALDVTSVKFESEVLSDGCGVQFSNHEDETFFTGKKLVPLKHPHSEKQGSTCITRPFKYS